MTDYVCDCSDEFGPCEAHGTVLAQRVGSSNRSADELSLVYLNDALDIDPECLSPYGRQIKAEAEAADAWEGSWLKDPDLADALRDVTDQVESYLDAWTVWGDGYVIVRPSPDCPLLEP
jgi:hypothetical protein